MHNFEGFFQRKESFFRNVSLGEFLEKENLIQFKMEVPKMRNQSTFKFSSILIIFIVLITPISTKEQYVEPILFGMKVNIPYDMANLFNRFPFQGALSFLLGLALAGILFFGVITAPFGYMFGVPSEKYVLGDFALKHPEADAASKRIITQIESHLPQSFIESPRSSSVLLDYIRSEKASARAIFSDQRQHYGAESEPCCQTFLYYFDAIIGYMEFWEPGFIEKWKPYLTVLRNRLGGRVGTEIVNTVESTLKMQYTPEYIKSMFYLISEETTDVRNDVCQQRMVCHAHGTLPYFPSTLLKLYHKFSKKLVKIPPGYKEAMRIGMKNETQCTEIYSECRDNAFTLTLKSYLSLLPDRKEINKMPRRKQKMYSKMNFLK